MIVVPIIDNIDIDFCTAGNDLVAIRNFNFGDSSRRIPDNSVGTRVFLRRNIQQNITVFIRGHIKGVIAALNVIFFVCKRRRVCSFNILQVDNELLFIAVTVLPVVPPPPETPPPVLPPPVSPPPEWSFFFGVGTTTASSLPIFTLEVVPAFVYTTCIPSALVYTKV